MSRSLRNLLCLVAACTALGGAVPTGAQDGAQPAPVPMSEHAPAQPAAAPESGVPSDSTGPAMQPMPGPEETAGSPGVAAANLPHDLSPWNMFMSADVVVKAVMIGLAFASVVTWTVWLAKAAGREMNRGTGVLATIGSTAPFVGLFGTVWGIMNSFIGISESQTTNLAVVAPGIAEALLATAIGLVAAIPAVIIYNQFARAISSYKALVAEVSAEVQRLVSRDLDRGSAVSVPASAGGLAKAAE